MKPPRAFHRFFLILALFQPAILFAENNTIILSVFGELACCPEGEVHLTQADLLAMPQSRFATRTPWTREQNHYQGVSLEDLASLIGLTTKRMRLTALNRYTTEVDVQPLIRGGAILAILRDDQPMPVRHQGPIWLLLPLDDKPHLNTADYHHTLVWQLRSIHALD